MQLTRLLSFGLIGFSLSFYVNGCKSKEFKGGTAARTVKSQNATAEPTEPSKPTPVEGEAEPPVETIDITPTTGVEIPRVVQNPISIVNTFWASVTNTEDFSFTLDTKSTSTTFKLSDIYGSKAQSHSQNTRTLTTDSYKQGTSGMPVTQVFEQKDQKGLIDILVVVDNSGSMDVEQKNLSTKLSSLLTFIDGSNWQIGVITTDAATYNGSCRMTLIRSTDANAEAVFKAATTPGITGSGYEQGIRQAVVGLGCTSNRWLRDNASTAVLFVTDADNCTYDGQDCGTNPWAKETYLIDYVENTLKKEFWKNFGVYGIFSLPSKTCNVAEAPGKQYQRLMDYKNNPRVHNNAGDICASDYSSILKEISKDISQLLDNQFELSGIPDGNPVKLSIGGVTVPAADYTLVGKTITFKAGKEPGVGKSLKVEYNVGSTSRFNAITLNNNPVVETLSVRVDSRVLTKSEYTLTGNVISFNSQPADRSTISVDYRIAGPLINAFQLEKTPLANSLKVLVDGKAPVGMMFDAAKNQVVFNPPPADGAGVVINYDYRVGPNLSYTVSSANGATNHKVFDGANEIPALKNGNVYTIKEANHALGKVLTLKYDVPDGAIRNFELPHTPDEGSVSFKKDIPSCKLNSGITVSGKLVSANCAVNSKSDFELSYKYSEKYDSFTVEVPDPAKGIWEVRVDGVKLDTFDRQGNTIKIDFAKYLKLDSVIEVRYTLPE